MSFFLIIGTFIVSAMLHHLVVTREIMAILTVAKQMNSGGYHPPLPAAQHPRTPPLLNNFGDPLHIQVPLPS